MGHSDILNIIHENSAKGRKKSSGPGSSGFGDAGPCSAENGWVPEIRTSEEGGERESQPPLSGRPMVRDLLKRSGARCGSTSTKVPAPRHVRRSGRPGFFPDSRPEGCGLGFGKRGALSPTTGALPWFLTAGRVRGGRLPARGRAQCAPIDDNACGTRKAVRILSLGGSDLVLQFRQRHFSNLRASTRE